MTLLGITKDAKLLHSPKTHSPIEVTLLGISMDVKLSHDLKASLPIEVTPVKYFNSLNEVMSVLLKTLSRSVTAAASVSLSSPSLLVSQLATQSTLTLASTKLMFCAPANNGRQQNKKVIRLFFISTICFIASQTPRSRLLIHSFMFPQIYKKGVGVCSSAYPGFVGLRIALITQDRQRSSAHASTNYIL